MVLAGFGVLGGQGGLNNLTAVGRAGAITGPYAIGLLPQSAGGPNAGFLAIGVAALLGAILISLAPVRQVDR
ncbi:MAG: hypothetical protein WBD07_05250 [Vicinamibacterales bacterium]